MGWYDSAQVCPNGHVTNRAMSDRPAHNVKFCQKCGEKTLTECSSCRCRIRGDYILENALMLGVEDFEPPAFCHNCGRAFPWTERRKQAAIDLFADEVSDEAERKLFRENLDAIAKDSPQAQVASGRLKKAIAKITSGTGDVIRKLVVDVAAQTLKGSFALLNPSGGS